MFSLPKLPPKLQAPFGLLGDNAKLAFRSQPSGILRLADPTTTIEPTDRYWEQFWTLFDTTSDVFSLITTHDIRLALIQNPRNIATLVRVLSIKLFTLVSDHTFPSPSNMPVPLVGSFMGSLSRNPTKEALNCLRVLTRVFPPIFELDSEEFEQALFWTREENAEDDPKDGETVNAESQFVIADDEDDEDPKTPLAAAEQRNPSPSGPCLAEKLISCVMDLLFCCGFTLPSKVQVDHYKINFTIWEKGVGSTANPGSAQAVDQNRIEVLRFLLVLLSRPLYFSPATVLTRRSLYTEHLVQKMPRRNILTLLCSLLNTSMNSVNAAFTIPYNHLVWKGEDVRGNLVSLSLQILCIALGYQAGSARDKESGNDECTPTSKTNAFRHSIAKLHRTADFEFILNGILSILEKEVGAISNFLPGSSKPPPYLLESVVLLWNVIEINKKFRDFVLTSERSPDLLLYLLCMALEIKDKPQQHGLSRTLSYIIQALSAEPALGTKMTGPIKTRIPGKWIAPGNVGDFVVNAIYSIVVTSSGQLSSLYPALIIALSNVSPYLQKLSVNSATRLIQLLKAFSNPAFLLSDEGHPRLLYFLLEVFNSIIFYNLGENPNVLYGMLRSHKMFEDLGTFTLPRGLREIRRMQLQRERQAQPQNQQQQQQRPKKSTSPEPLERDAGQEKAQLLQNENSAGVARHPQSQRGSVDEPHSDPQSRRDSFSGDSLPPLTEEGPWSPAPAGAGAPEGSVSEKVRGKRPERTMSSSNLVLTEDLERIAQAGVGRNGFVPTQEWVTSWQQGLPLDTILLTISELLPKAHQLQNASSNSSSSATPTETILSFLRSVNLSHVLPTVPPLNPRRFQWTEASSVWLTSLVWGEIYVRGTSPYGIWNGTNIRLFHLKHTQAPSRQISDAVSTVVGGLGGLLGGGGGGVGSRSSDGSTNGTRARVAR